MSRADSSSGEALTKSPSRGEGGRANNATTSSRLLPARTPSMASMKSAVPAAQSSFMMSSRTPAGVAQQHISTFLPKTPAPGDNKKPRNARRNEMVYHMILSENGSPIEAPLQPSHRCETF